MEKGALTHIEYAQFILARIPFLPHKTHTECDSGDSETYATVKFFVISTVSNTTFGCIFVGTFKENSIQYSLSLPQVEIFQLQTRFILFI